MIGPRGSECFFFFHQQKKNYLKETCDYIGIKAVTTREIVEITKKQRNEQQ